jgi:hypothetical protein
VATIERAIWLTPPGPAAGVISQPSAWGKYMPLGISLTKSQSKRRWKAIVSAAIWSAVRGSAAKWPQNAIGGRSRSRPLRAARTRSRGVTGPSPS